MTVSRLVKQSHPGTVIGALIGAILVDLIDNSLVRWALVSEFWREAVLALVKREGIEREGGTWSQAEEAAFRAPLLEKYEREGHPLYSSARLWDDGVIDPAKSREVLGLSLSAARNAPVGDTKFGVFRM